MLVRKSLFTAQTARKATGTLIPYGKAALCKILLAVLLVLSVSSTGTCAEQAPLPADIKIVPPGPEVPADLAKLSGKWVGTLAGQGQGKYPYSYTAQHVLIVEKIDEVGVITVIYARGDISPAMKSYPPAFWARYRATWGASTKELMVSYPYENQYATVVYKLNAEGKLTATGQIGAENRQASLHRE